MKLLGSFKIGQFSGTDTSELESECISFEITDNVSGVLFCRGTMTRAAFADAILNHSGWKNCTLDVRGTQHIGKIVERREIDIPMPKDAIFKDRSKIAYERGVELVKDGWILSEYFGSRGSFYTRDGKDYARGTITRYVDTANKKETT